MRGLQSPQGGCCRGALKEKSDMILFCFFTILFLFFLSIEDLKSRRVRLLPALIFAGGMFLAHLILKDLPLKELLWGILLGAGLFAVSLITHSAIGGGDAPLSSFSARRASDSDPDTILPEIISI